MKFTECTDIVISLCNDTSLDFRDKGNRIQEMISKCSLSDFLDHLDHAGIIPECFGHDSTEEKVFAKYCDVLLARALSEIGLKSMIIEERADSADVLSEGTDYKLVGDAKAFRLSRTAKNQKDFKVEALNTWRKGADYACLVSPIYQFPSTNSQIYVQAIRYNVTLLSYTHLSFLIKNYLKYGFKEELKLVWEVGVSLRREEADSSTVLYWQNLTNTILKITNSALDDWEKAVKHTMSLLPKQAKRQVDYWEEEKRRVNSLSHDQAVAELIKALKIDTKIQIIKKTAGL